MSMILSTDDGLDYHVNVWNWGVLHHMVAIENIFPEEIWEPLYYNLGYELNAEQVTILADFLETKLLPSLKAGERLFFNGTITNNQTTEPFIEMRRMYGEIIVFITMFLFRS